MRLSRLAPAGLVLAALALAGCGAGDDPADTGEASDAPVEERTLTVAAAASLQNAFTDIGELFEQENDGVTVEFSFAGSSSLVTQLAEGAPGDVFASADQANMDTAVEDGLVEGEAPIFARNTLEIVTPPDNPAGVESLADLAGSDLRLVVCAPQVPCGAATEAVAENAGLTFSPVSEEQSVTDVLGRVTSGEADAGLVYITDAEAAGDDVHRVPFEEADDVVNDYPIAVLAGAVDADLAADFVAFVTGEQGLSVLSSYGFLAP